nr:zinc finger, CCHC-type [Tanacetum cinerariifolium]
VEQQNHLQSDAATRGDAPESLTLQLVSLMSYCKPQIWPRPHEIGYSLARKQVSLSSIPQSQLSQLHDPPGHRDVVNKTSNSLYYEHLPAAAELSPTSYPGLGAVSSSLFRGGVSALGISAMRLVDGTGRVYGGQICGDKKGGGSEGVGAEATSGISMGQVHTLENVVPAPATVEQPPRRDPQMEYSKVVPQSEQKYRSSGIDDEVVQDQRQRVDNDLQDERQDQPKKEEVEPKRCKRARTEKSFRPNFVSFMVEKEPTSYREAELVGLLSGCKPLGYKRIFKKKMKANGTIDKMVLAIAALGKLEVHQMDMKMIFLNGDLENVLYMNQPEGFMAHGLESKVCRLVKSLYDSRKALKQGY